MPPRDTASAASNASSGVDTRTAGMRPTLWIFAQTSAFVIVFTPYAPFALDQI
jgi:hypothetical protein